jgi:hypothetical protein
VGLSQKRHAKNALIAHLRPAQHSLHFGLVERNISNIVFWSIAELHHFFVALAPGKNFDAAPAPTLLYSKAKFLK